MNKARYDGPETQKSNFYLLAWPYNYTSLRIPQALIVNEKDITS